MVSVKEFRALCKEQYGVTITKSQEPDVMELEYAKLAFNNVKFNCKFTDNGCRNYTDRDTDTRGKCCCVNCYWNLGYLRLIQERHLAEYAKLWSKTNGFWKKGEGCRLRRNLRSITCTTFTCLQINHNTKTLSSIVGNLLRHIEMRHIRKLKERG